MVYVMLSCFEIDIANNCNCFSQKSQLHVHVDAIIHLSFLFDRVSAIDEIHPAIRRLGLPYVLMV